MGVARSAGQERNDEQVMAGTSVTGSESGCDSPPGIQEEPLKAFPGVAVSHSCVVSTAQHRHPLAKTLRDPDCLSQQSLKPAPATWLQT